MFSAGRAEKAAVALLAVIATARALIFGLAFPFYGNVDEQAHIDQTLRFRHLQLPAGLEPFTSEGARLASLYNSPEFRYTPANFPDNRYPPRRWESHTAETARDVELEFVRWRTREVNIENGQAPAYYVVAAGWLAIGEKLHLTGIRLLYWLRGLSALLAGVFVVAVYAASLRLRIDRVLRLGVATLIAFIPQDCFYTIDNDVFTPLPFVLALAALYELYQGETRLGAWLRAGWWVSLAMLAKFTNAPILLVAVFVCAIVLARNWRQASPCLARVACFGSVLMLLVGGWMLRNILIMHDVSGAALKAARLGWTMKPISQMLNHPIFTPSGAWHFWTALMATLWRGELFWQGAPLRSVAWDAIYAWTSLLLPIAAILWSFGRSATRLDRRVIAASAVTFTCSALLLVWWSIAFDFGPSFYPSRASPYVTSGRLIIGALFPLLILYMRGLVVLVRGGLKIVKLDAWTEAASLVLVCAYGVAMLVGEIDLSRSVFQSAYNWFALT